MTTTFIPSFKIAFNQWARQEYSHIKPGLDRIAEFFKITSREKNTYPSEGLPIIHIAGTNGKGSVASYLSFILISSGLKTGLYTSPHLLTPLERIKLNGTNIPQTHLEKLFKKYSREIKKSRLTFFETMTALAIIYFSDEKADIAVMEVGVGGKWDATNICRNKLLSIITSISKDHTDLFGPDIKKIASEDLGIIQKNVPLVCGKLENNLIKFVSEYTSTKHSTAYFYGKDFSSANPAPDWKNLRQKFDYIEDKLSPIVLKNIAIPLMGTYQTINAAVAIKSARILSEKFPTINETSIRKGLLKTRWPGRFEIIKQKRGETLIIDGAHNEEAVRNFTREYRQSPFYKNGKTQIIFGCLKEKDHESMAKHIARIADEILITKPSSPRAQNPSVIKKTFLYTLRQTHKLRLKPENIKITPNLKTALIRSIQQKNTSTVVIGSLYLVSEAIKIIKNRSSAIYRTF